MVRLIFPLTCKGQIQIPLMGIEVAREKMSYMLEQEGCKEVVATDHNKISFKGTPYGKGFKKFWNMYLYEITKGYVEVKNSGEFLSIDYFLKLSITSYHFFCIAFGTFFVFIYSPLALAHFDFPLKTLFQIGLFSSLFGLFGFYIAFHHTKKTTEDILLNGFTN